MAPRWQPGDSVLWRGGIDRGAACGAEPQDVRALPVRPSETTSRAAGFDHSRWRVRWAIPHNFVGERDGRVMLYCRPGARGKGPKHPFIDFPQQLVTGEWEIIEHVWRTHHVLRITPLARAHSINLFWSEVWSFRGWYVNLQAPLRRSALGFDTRDHALDITVEPDGSWAWKDEDHLEQAVDIGLYTDEEAKAIRAEGERVLAERPWPTGWEDWRPDPAWPLPTLPDGWETW